MTASYTVRLGVLHRSARHPTPSASVLCVVRLGVLRRPPRCYAPSASASCTVTVEPKAFIFNTSRIPKDSF